LVSLSQAEIEKIDNPPIKTRHTRVRIFFFINFDLFLLYYDFFDYFCTAKLIILYGMKVKKMTFLLLFFATVISCQSQKTNNQTNDAQKKYYVQIETSYGNMTVELFNETPKHRDNFIKLVNEGFYDDLLFHRVINNFMIQGGDPNSRNAKPGQMLGNGTLGYTIPAEFVPGLIHRKGALAAARQGDAVNPTKASSSCQFYIVQGNVWPLERLQMMANQMGRTLDQRQIEAYTTVGGTPHLDYDYTVFGQVIEGLDVIDKIAAVKCDRSDRPVEDVKMKIKVIKR